LVHRGNLAVSINGHAHHDGTGAITIDARRVDIKSHSESVFPRHDLRDLAQTRIHFSKANHRIQAIRHHVLIFHQQDTPRARLVNLQNHTTPCKSTPPNPSTITAPEFFSVTLCLQNGCKKVSSFASPASLKTDSRT
jgi:hypothetical protein